MAPPPAQGLQQPGRAGGIPLLCTGSGQAMTALMAGCPWVFLQEVTCPLPAGALPPCFPGFPEEGLRAQGGCRPFFLPKWVVGWQLGAAAAGHLG